ncbi:Putative esterase, PHB depolymerase, alpha/Beta hydrolase [Septoria linicola]|uniref:Esterase, PHB depolymerase, alpha/Beta hydrolase n=1 Tax=Septoria linicola TaxID=215465 RepID=A0A9Q9AUE0_9PEZI|nr:putative esterase, PHB depolymerase, alpha/Beta hydrolase [Septoria linicola]USW52182.1 Putative esterase, PHB depolymerase, alpha/Beta hydrolase [Septoria linicola]
MYTIDSTSITVSGFSAGGFMAAQLAIAYSSNFSAFGIFAGGPYDCARNQDFFTVCMYNATPSIELPTSNIKEWSAEGRIESIDNLLSKKVYVQSGVLDEVIGLSVTRELVTQLENFVSRENIRHVELEGAAHVFPTNSDILNITTSAVAKDIQPQCNSSTHPFIANCGYDGAGEMLQWLYNDNLTIPPSKPKTSELQGTLHKYPQTHSLGAMGLAEHGYYYLPSTCRPNSTSLQPRKCKLHLALHGCTMSHNDIGEIFLRSSGYLDWAEANDMVVMFPQAERDETLRPIWNGTEFAGGALACFDWIGWVGDDADWKSGKQMRAIMNAVEWIAKQSEGEEGEWRRDDEL